MFKGLYEVGLKYWETRDDDIYYNVNDIWLSFNTKCNFLDTVQGTVIINFIANRFQYDNFILSLAIRGLDLFAMIMDISDLARLYTIFMNHQDAYVVGTILGKVTKLLAQAYMSGILDQVIHFVMIILGPS